MRDGLPMAGFYGGHVLNFGHRGASYDAPENTLAAFELAAQVGADGVELDVTLSADNQVVVIHDDTLDRTTDGAGLVRAKTLAELKEFDAGTWFHPRFSGERIPTLGEVLDAVGSRVLVNVELKGLTREEDGLETAVADLIAQYGMASRVVISAFNPLRLRRMRRVAPQLPVGFLHDWDTPTHLRWVATALMTGFRPDADHPHEEGVTPAYVVRCHRRGQRVNAWVVNDPARMRDLVQSGVDMIITDRPAVFRTVQQGGK